MRSQILLSFLLVAGLAVAGCAPTLANRGTLLDPEKLATIKPGSTRDNVVTALGSPSSRGSFDENVWYYIGRRTKQTAFLDPDVTEQQIVTIRFTEDGLVKTIEKTGVEAAQDVAAAGGETATFGTETSWFQDLFGNIGRAGLPTGRQR